MKAPLILSQARSFPEGRSQLVATVRRSFSFATGSLTEVAAAPLRDAFECAVNRFSTDVVLEGHVYLKNAQSSVGEILVGGNGRRVRAFGPRVVQSASSCSVSWSQPTPTERIPLLASEAYGGSWEAQVETVESFEQTLAFYPRNPKGRGFVTAERAADLVGTFMPALEDPESPVAPETIVRQEADDWLDAPFPPLFGWMEPIVFPRCRFFGGRPSHRPWRVVPRECELGVLKPNEIGSLRLAHQVEVVVGSGMTIVIESRAFSAGALGLSNNRLLGGEPVVLRGFFHDAHESTFVVPRYRTVVGITPPGCPRFDKPSTLSALLIDADARVVTTVEQSMLEVAAPYPDTELRAVRVEVLNR